MRAEAESVPAVRSDLVHEMTRRCRSLGAAALALGDVLESLPAGALAPLVQARATVKLADLQAQLEALADGMGCVCNPPGTQRRAKVARTPAGAEIVRQRRTV